MKKTLYAFCALLLCVALGAVLVACDDADTPTSQRYTYESLTIEPNDSISQAAAEAASAMFEGSEAYFEGGQFCWSLDNGSGITRYDYTVEEDGRYRMAYSDSLSSVFGEADMYVTFDETSLTIIAIYGESGENSLTYYYNFIAA